MKVTVIIPVYNAEAYIKQAVESAMACVEVAEIILIEDHSPQNDWAECQALQQLYPDMVKLYRTPQNMGAGAARNIGLKKATQAYIAFLDADDVFLPHRFEKDKEVYEQNPNCDGVYNALGNTYWDEQGQLKYNNRVEEFTCPKGSIAPENLVYECSPLGTKGHFSLVAFTTKKNVLKTIGFFNENLKATEDTEWIIRILVKNIILKGELGKAVALRGMHANNLTNDKNIIKDHQYQLYKSLLDVGVNKSYPFSLLRIIFNRYVGYYLKQHPGKIHLLRIYFNWLFKKPKLVLSHYNSLVKKKHQS